MPREPLGDKVPTGLEGRAATIYRTLARELAVEGYACQSDWRSVALAAKTEAHLERLEREVADLPTLSVKVDGAYVLHPLVREVRSVRTQLASLYGALLLTPRARSSSRLTEAQGRQAATKRDELEEFLQGGPA